MIKEIEEFFKRSHDHSAPCAEYALKIKNAGSVKEVFDIAVQTPCLEYICKSIDDGWGIEREAIERIFKPYINGRYVYNGKYSSSLYCGAEGRITAENTVYCLIGCDVTLYIEEEWRMCKIFAVGGTRVRIEGYGVAFTDFCGHDCEIVNNINRV